MKKIDITDYKNYKQYFKFYDAIIKQVSSNKESFLESIYLSPSSYRRAKNDGNKIGKQLLEELCNHFMYKMIDNDIVEEIADKINAIYFNVYYKKYDSYEEDIRWIESTLEKKYIIYPVILLFKLLLLINSQNNPKNVLQDNIKIYKELQQFNSFFNNDLQEIFEIIHISFENEIDNNVLSTNYKNELSYYTLSTKCILVGRYIEAIYFGEKAKHLFIKEENYKRVYYANLNLMSAYIYLQKYNDCYILAQKQIISLESQKIFEFEFAATLRHYIISCLGLGKYYDILRVLDNKKQLNKTELCCYLIAKYKINKDDYLSYMNSLKNSIEYDRVELNFFDTINNFIINGNKKMIILLEKIKITQSVIDILKKM